MIEFVVTLGFLVTVIAVVFIAAAMRPAEFHLERTVTIAAKREDVFRIVRDLKRYDEWSPWSDLDRSMRITHEGDSANVGGSYAWEGNDKVGAGKMTITSMTAPERVEIKLEFMRPFPAVNQVRWTLVDLGGETAMTWVMEGRHESVFAKAFGMLMMDRLVGKSFEQGLAKLKGVAERSAPAAAA